MYDTCVITKRYEMLLIQKEIQLMLIVKTKVLILTCIVMTFSCEAGALVNGKVDKTTSVSFVQFPI